MKSDQANLWHEQGIVHRNGVPFVTYGFWFSTLVGGPSGKRREALDLMAQNLGTPFLLLTRDNVTDFQLPQHPFHPAVNYTLTNGEGLSGNHLSDYLRLYFSFHYGGAYHDIKPRIKSQSIEVRPLCLKKGGSFSKQNVYLLPTKTIQFLNIHLKQGKKVFVRTALPLLIM